MPFLPDKRQYRSFSADNLRSIEREDGGESYVVRGYFTTFDEEYRLYEDFYESIDRMALDNADMSDVIFQENHEGSPLARQRNKSLRVGIDDHGGWCEADLGGCQRGREIHESIKNGLIVEMSFGFSIAEDGFEWEEDEDGTVHSRIKAISRVYDVSCVSIPANPGTEISARSYLDGAIEAERRRLEESQRAERQRRHDAAEALRGMSLL